MLYPNCKNELEGAPHSTLAKDAIYAAGISFMDDKGPKYSHAIEEFKKIPGYKDADDLVKECT